MTPEQRKILSDACKEKSHALRGTIAPLQTVTRLLGAPASDLTEELKISTQTKLQQLAALADWLDEVAGRLESEI